MISYRLVDYVRDLAQVGLLKDRPIKRWDAIFKSANVYLPRWIITLVLLPLMASETIANRFLKASTIRDYE